MAMMLKSVLVLFYRIRYNLFIMELDNIAGESVATEAVSPYVAVMVRFFTSGLQCFSKPCVVVLILCIAPQLADGGNLALMWEL